LGDDKKIPEWAKDRAKELVSALVSALVSGAIPIGTVRLSKLLLPFVNSQVPADLGLVSALLSIILALIVCVYARYPRPPDRPGTSATVLAFSGLVLAICGLFTMVILTNNPGLLSPDLESLLNRAGYIFFFVWAGAPIGYFVSRM